MRKRRIVLICLATLLCTTALTGCRAGSSLRHVASRTLIRLARFIETGNEEVEEAEEKEDVIPQEPGDDIIDFTMFSAMPGNEIADGNDIQELIAKRTGVRVKEIWLTGQTAAEAVGSMVAAGELPDFIDGGDAMRILYDYGFLVPWDYYLEKYPNLKELYSEKEWEKFRQDDGHIYWANVFCNHYGEDKSKTHNDGAFWIQARVLEWAGYPKIETVDEYFRLIEEYSAANPTFVNGEGEDVDVIPFTVLCDDWRYFCLESPPQFLMGYPNDGCVTVDKDTLTVGDYNSSEAARRYFGILNEEYNKGIIDKEFAEQKYDDYIAKLSTGAVLGMVDQNWDFNYTITPIFEESGLADMGCGYIPLGLTLDKGQEQRWHIYGDNLNPYSGIAITTCCKDPDRAFAFLNEILSQDIHDLRFWGVEGEDYLVDEDGMYYRTQEMREKAADPFRQERHFCMYSYMPQWLGTSRDGKNAMQPQEQASEFYATLSEPLANCLKAYGAEGYPDMIGSVYEEEQGIWFPMYSYSSAMAIETPGAYAWTRMGETKHEWLPKVVSAKNFDSEWDKYMKAYSDCKPEDFLSEMQEELEDRIEKGDH